MHVLKYPLRSDLVLGRMYVLYETEMKTKSLRQLKVIKTHFMVIQIVELATLMEEGMEA